MTISQSNTSFARANITSRLHRAPFQSCANLKYVQIWMKVSRKYSQLSNEKIRRHYKWSRTPKSRRLKPSVDYREEHGKNWRPEDWLYRPRGSLHSRLECFISDLATSSSLHTYKHIYYVCKVFVGSCILSFI